MLRSQHFVFSGDVLTASRCCSAQTVTYFLLFFSLVLLAFSIFSLSLFLCYIYLTVYFCYLPLLFLLFSPMSLFSLVAAFQLLNNEAAGCKITGCRLG